MGGGEGSGACRLTIVTVESRVTFRSLMNKSKHDLARDYLAWLDATWWRPIETAPRDGKRFLAWCTLTADELDEDDTVLKKDVVEHYAVVAYFVFGSFVEFPWRGGFVQNLRFTHWMPLPDGPQA